MGDEIQHCQFTDLDYQKFYSKLKQETELLVQLLPHLLATNVGMKNTARCGAEQEAWIVDRHHNIAPENQYLINQMPHSMLSPELAKFNIELNLTPQPLQFNGLSLMQSELELLWKKCEDILEKKSLYLEMIGILPTLQDKDLSIKNMSAVNRYQALNQQIMKSRNGKLLDLNIVGIEHLRSQHRDVMLESASTSFQLHRQVPLDKSAEYYNASIVISAIMVAISANSPFLFQKKLWEETRIPLFEQAVEVGGYGSAGFGPIRRVSFGTGYIKESILECFQENLAHFPVLLPVIHKEEPSQLSHLRMHNGTVWRWNRPIVGFNEDGEIHFRIEHRVIAAGPTIADEMANAAFFYGLQEYFAQIEDPISNYLNFSDAKSNFYSAAQHGLITKVNWPMGAGKLLEKISLKNLILKKLISCAEAGLQQLEIDEEDIARYLSIIEARVETGQTGSVWQKKFAEKSRNNMAHLLEIYSELRKSEEPVHQWNI